MSPQALMTRSSARWLLISLLLLLLLSPWSGEGAGGARLLDVLLTGSLIAGAYRFTSNRAHLRWALGLAALALIATWWAGFARTGGAVVVAYALLGTFFLVLVRSILGDVLRAERVTFDKLEGAVAVYLLLGILWALAFAIVAVAEPGSFTFTYERFDQLIYFSFTTLTTLGYGDLTPTSDVARVLAIFEAMTGQLYLAILVARLVALHITHERSDRRSSS